MKQEKIKSYNPSEIEPRWQAIWEKMGLFRAEESRPKAGQPRAEKFYGLVEFPYPSGDGLHTGHPRSYTAMDIICRKRRMEGYSVLYPIGFDSFGLPTENYAIKRKVNPKIITKENIAIFTRQLKSLGFSFDWSRVLSTSDPEYYKWTQWIFIKLFEHGLAYKAKENINWCTSCKIGLANEEVVGGVCERCGSEVIKKEREQWILKITKYADRLIDDLKNVDYLDRIKDQQINWIGRSEGATIKFEVASDKKYSEILLASNNKSKKERIEKLLKNEGLNVKVLIPQDLKIEPIDVEENGTLEENAKKKALAYRGKTDLPILGLDTGLFIDNKIIDPVKVKRNALRGKNEKDLTQEEIAQHLIDFYMDIAKKNGGTTDAYWKDVSVLSLPDGSIKTAENIREIILTDKIVGKVDIYFPLRSFYISKTTGKYINEQNEKEEFLELSPFADSLKKLLGGGDLLNVFTTRPDTIFGATFLVIAYNHPLIVNREPLIANYEEIEKYINNIKKAGPRLASLELKKTGVEIKGIKAINPATKKEIPIFVADYVSMDYGTGAIMAVPGHDTRDYAFAKRHNLTIIEVVVPLNNAQEKTQNNAESVNQRLPAGKAGSDQRESALSEAYEGDGININSGILNGLETKEAIEKAIKLFGEKTTNYHLRDWIFSRQRYWGEPIPLIFCPECKKLMENSKFEIRNSKQIQNSEINEGEILNPGWVAVSEKDLPVELPEVKDFMPTKDGNSPLAKAKDWVKTKCPKCGGEARRETDVMPNWAGSNWYFLAYAMRGAKSVKLKAKSEKQGSDIIWDKEKLKYWTPVDWYNGGMEHTTLHLLYSRFIYKFLYDIGVVPKECGPEPYKKRTAHGMILGEGGIKMSKSKGNVINPDDYVKEYGADTVRLYEMFMGPFDQAIPWEGKSVIGVSRFLSRVWELGVKFLTPSRESRIVNRESYENIERLLNQTIKKVGEDIEQMKFNTAVSQMMILLNEMEKAKDLPQEVFEKFLIILFPFAPHITEEIWQSLRTKNEKRKVKNEDSKFPSYAKASAGKQIPNSKFKSISEEPWPEYDEKLIKKDIFSLVVQVNGKVREMIECPMGISESEAKEKALSSSKIIGWTRGKEIIKIIFVKDKLINFVVK